MRHLSIDDFNSQEQAVFAETTSALSGFFDYSPRALNLLIELMYAAPRDQHVSPARDAYSAQCIHWFYSALYTFNAATRLMSLGYYFEGQVLLRTLVEILVKLRYFDKHPEEVDELPSLAAGKKGSITWRRMFDDVWPGYYDEYSNLSYEAHGGVGANVYKLEHDANGGRALIMGLKYSEFWASAFINQVTPLLLGYLRAFVTIFGTDWLTEELHREYAFCVKTLTEAIRAHIERYGRNDWHDRVEPMWNC